MLNSANEPEAVLQHSAGVRQPQLIRNYAACSIYTCKRDEAECWGIDQAPEFGID